MAGALGAPSMHVMVVRARTVGAKNTKPKNLAPRGMQSEADMILTLECQNSAGGLERAKEFAKSITLGIFRGPANLLPVLCGESFWPPLRKITRASVSRIAAQQELEIQSEPQGEDALFSRVGSEYGGEF